MKWSRIAAAQQMIARERGTIIKDWGGKIPIALVYPNTYHVGMSSLALHTLYRLFNAEPDIVCERVFCGNRHLEHEASPFSMESQQQLGSFAVLAATFSFELDYLHFVTLLRNAGIPPLSDRRDASYPLLLAGGPAVSANPAPLAALFDAIVIGEVEEILPLLLSTLRDGLMRPRRTLLETLTRVPGVYVPSQAGSEPAHVSRQWVRDLDLYPTHTSVLTPATEFGDRFLIEIARGCHRSCRFCLARSLYHPMRERSAAHVLETALASLPLTAKVGLVSTAVSDYSQIDALVSGLLGMGLQISVSSLRIDPLPEILLSALAESGVRTMTVAPEAGSERLRRAIRKGISQQDILDAASAASRYDFAELKLYFMVGLPGETEDDIDSIVELVRAISGQFHRRLLVSATPFVPKAHTPYEREAMTAGSVLNRRLSKLRSTLRAVGIRVRSESVGWSTAQAVLARGDGRLGAVLADVGRPSLSSWRRALRDHALTQEEYAAERPAGEPLPWDFVRS